MTQTIIIILLFLYSSWAFVRIGRLNNRIDRQYEIIEQLLKRVDIELSEIWEAFTQEVKNRKEK